MTLSSCFGVITPNLLDFCYCPGEYFGLGGKKTKNKKRWLSDAIASDSWGCTLLCRMQADSTRGHTFVRELCCLPQTMKGGGMKGSPECF